MAEAAQTRLLDLPDAVLERILLEASEGRHFGGLDDARLACRRLRAVAYAAVRKLEWHAYLSSDGLAPLALLPRFDTLARLELHIEICWKKEEAAVFEAMVDEIPGAVCRCVGEQSGLAQSSACSCRHHISNDFTKNHSP
jgi:hypothetical protein